MHCKLCIGMTRNDRRVLREGNNPIMMRDLNYELMEEYTGKSKIIIAGSHRSIAFIFAPLPLDSLCSSENGETFCRYYLKAELILNGNRCIEQTLLFRVKNLPLDDNPVAMECQTKSDSKLFKKVGMKVTIPKAIGTHDAVPISLSMQNISTHSKLIIRSQLVKTRVLPSCTNRDPSYTFTEDSNVEEICLKNSEISHILKVNAGHTFRCSLVCETYKIQVEVETEKGDKLKVEFPVIVGEWKGKATRDPTSPATTSSLEASRPSAPPQPPSAPVPPPPVPRTASLAPPPKVPSHGNQAANHENVKPSLLFPKKSSNVVPSAPPMEFVGFEPPPSYYDAMKHSTLPSNGPRQSAPDNVVLK